MNVVNNARKDLDAEIARKRKEMRAAHKTVIVAEDEPSVYKQELHKRAVKVNGGDAGLIKLRRVSF